MSAGNFTLGVALGNDAFQPDPAPELVAILRSVADRLEAGGLTEGFTFAVRDSNGNRVGSCTLINEDSPT
jgi:hypothetical protein